MNPAYSFSRLMRWEVRRLVAERTGLALLLLWCGLLTVASVQGWRQTTARQREIADALARDTASWSAKRALLSELEGGRAMPAQYRDPRNPVHAVFGAGGDRPVALLTAPLAALAAGSGDLAPPVQRAGMITKLHLPPASIDNPANRLAGPLDFSFVVGTLLPLFVLALGFDVLAREREARTWPLLASQPVSPRTVMTARLAVHFLALWLPLTLAAAVAVLASRAPAFSLISTICELGLWLGLAAIYLVFWQTLAAWVNERGWSAATNALALCGAWLAAVLLVPSVVQNVVNAIAPPPDRRAFILEVRAIDTDLFKRVEEIRDAYYATDPALKPTVALNEYDTYFLQNLWPRALATDAALAPTLESLAAARREQAVWWRRLAWLSPTLSFRLATEQLAGVTPVQQSTLIDEARIFQRVWREHFGAKLAAMRPLTLADYDGKPAPRQIELRFGKRLRTSGPALIGLILFTFSVLTLALRSHPRPA